MYYNLIAILVQSMQGSFAFPNGCGSRFKVKYLELDLEREEHRISRSKDSVTKQC